MKREYFIKTCVKHISNVIHGVLKMMQNVKIKMKVLKLVSGPHSRRQTDRLPSSGQSRDTLWSFSLGEFQ